MAEDQHLGAGQASIPGLSSDDIIPTIYEGGFKTWEGAIDLANYLLRRGTILDSKARDLHIIEVAFPLHRVPNFCALELTRCQLGVGTGLPTIALLHHWLQLPDLPTKDAASGLHLTLADYNQSVLELATIPNLFLTVSLSLHPSTSSQEVDVSPEIINEFTNELVSHGVSVSAISGSWSSEFSALLPPLAHEGGQTETLVLASETIYSPATLHAFTTTMLGILDGAKEAGCKARALVAAKMVYFGLGGGVDEFLVILRQLGGDAKVVWQSEGAGVGRLILEVTKVDRWQKI